jgi:hypothetical protein
LRLDVLITRFYIYCCDWTWRSNSNSCHKKCLTEAQK